MSLRTNATLAVNYTLIAALCAGCVANPARGLTPNDVDPVVEETSANRMPGLYRGDDKLDEQDFYYLVGDKKSGNEIKSSRSSGERKQKIGGVLLGLGIGIVGFGLAAWILPKGGPLGEKGLFEPIYPVDNVWLNYLVIGVGGFTTWGGSALLKNGKEQASGAKLMFPLKHAQTSLENAEYGEGGLKPENIKSLALATFNGKSYYCGNTGIQLAPLVGKDEKGREVKLSRHEDWLEWTTDPKGLLERQKSSNELEQSSIFIKSPLRESLDAVGKQVKIDVTIKGTDVSASLLLSQEFSCTEVARYWGERGQSGDRGNRGDTGSRGGSGGDGSDGGDGGDGGDGIDVEVEAAWVVDSSGNRYALIAIKGEGDSKPIRFLMAKGTQMGIMASGGSGGSGGDGGDGGSGSSSDSGKTPDYCAGNGGNGGNGGRGGKGGKGGNVKVKVVNEDLLEIIDAVAPGGNGGSAGSAGSAGYKGSDYSECSKFNKASSGSRGTSGTSGSAGKDGTVKKQTASAGEMSLIAEVLQGVSNLKLEGSGGSKPKKR